MKCKNCDKGLVLEISVNTETDVVMEPVACDCCGGYYEQCDNCDAGKRVIEWVDE